MADMSGDGMGSATFWQVIVGAASMVAGFVGGSWSKGVAAGRQEGGATAKMDSLHDRMTRQERRSDVIEDRVAKMDDRLDEKMSRMAERIAATPTRDEIAVMFARLERKLDDRRDEGV